LRTDRLLTLSEDLPLVSVAVDARPRIERALHHVERLEFDGLVTLERARMVSEPVSVDGQAKLTAYLGRHERPGHEAVVDVLRRHGVAGATVLLGVDGTAHGRRERARLLGRNERVPLMVIAVGDGAAIARALPDLGGVLARPLLTLERVTVCKRDGERLAPLPPGEPGMWQKLMIYAGEQSRVAPELTRALRRARAAGATTLRGIWGFHGDHAPHGDLFWQLRRRVPTVTVVVDAPERIRELWPIVDAHTARTGLVTSELVPRAIVRGAQAR
jgi:PII-like signaling protein